jgi:hypothetical protein
MVASGAWRGQSVIMALFTSKADADLPLLTKLYQAEADPALYPDPDELGRLVVSTTADIFPKFAARYNSWQEFVNSARSQIGTLRMVQDGLANKIAMAEAEAILRKRSELGERERAIIYARIQKENVPNETRFLFGRATIWLDENAPEIGSEAVIQASEMYSKTYDVSDSVKHIMDSLADNNKPDIKLINIFNSVEARYDLQGQLEWDEPKAMYRIGPSPRSERYWSPPLLFIQRVTGALFAGIQQGTKFRRCVECESVYPMLREGRIFCSYRCANRAAVRNKRGVQTPANK